MRHTIQKPTSKDRFRILFEHSSDPHFIFMEGGITDCNDATIQILKLKSKEDVLKLHPAVLSPRYQPDGRLSSEKSIEMDRIALEKGFHRFEWTHQNSKGETFPVVVTVNAVTIDGKPAMIAVWHDLTELKQKEDRLRLANEKMKSDLQAAATIQRSLLPTSSPLFKGLRASWIFKPCDDLGGDMLNIFSLDENHLGFYVLDVTGHGVAASLLSVAASQFLSPYSESSFLRKLKSRIKLSVESPAGVAEKLNRHFTANPDFLQMFTLFYGILNVESLELRYTCAGHPFPILVSGGNPKVVGEVAVPIGVAYDSEYQEFSLKLKRGDRLYLYSDGIIEAKNAARELFSQKRLMELLSQTNGDSLPRSIEKIAAETEAWCKPLLPDDDVTILACEFQQ